MSNKKEIYIENNHLIIEDKKIILGAPYFLIKTLSKKEIPAINDFINYWFSAEMNNYSLMDKFEKIITDNKMFGKYTAKDCLKAINIYEMDKVMLWIQPNVPDLNNHIKGKVLEFAAVKIGLTEDKVKKIQSIKEQKDLLKKDPIKNRKDLEEIDKELEKMSDTLEAMEKLIEAEMEINKYIKLIS